MTHGHQDIVTEPVTSLARSPHHKWSNMESGGVQIAGPYILTSASKSPFNLKKMLMLGSDSERGLTLGEEIANTGLSVTRDS